MLWATGPLYSVHGRQDDELFKQRVLQWPFALNAAYLRAESLYRARLRFSRFFLPVLRRGVRFE